MGVCYEKGLGVQQNLAEAMRHYRQSAAAGNRNARERLRVLEEEVEGTRGGWGRGYARSHKSRACLARGEVAQARGKTKLSLLKGPLFFLSSFYQLFPGEVEKLVP